MSKPIHWNDTAILRAEFRLVQGNALANPTAEGLNPAVILRLKDPNGVITRIDYPNAVFAIVSQGIWTATLEGPWLAGPVELTYRYEFLSFGAAKAGGESLFRIAATNLPPPP